jgi:hypothetical protein
MCKSVEVKIHSLLQQFCNCPLLQKRQPSVRSKSFESVAVAIAADLGFTFGCLFR